MIRSSPVTSSLRLLCTVALNAAVLSMSNGTLEAQQEAGPPSTNPTMSGLATYVGLWRAEDQVGSDGRTSHFVYKLSWFDSSRSIVEMLILHRFADGEERLLWRGFKGWDPHAERVYYNGFSSGGRAARGHVKLVGEDLVTEYDGWGPDGSLVRVQDIFTPVRDGAFSGRTLVRATPDGEWRQVSSDRWRRIAAHREIHG